MNSLPNSNYRKLIYIILILVILTPLGLLTTYSSWGEWSKDEIQKMIGYVPQGFSKLADFWKGLLPDYQYPSASSWYSQFIWYGFSAVLGAGLVYLLITFLLKKKN
jgi:uncharacterized membrane protein YjdF